MTNQRAGKTHKAALGDGSQEMLIRNFFLKAATMLEDAGHKDAAFYFEQVVEHIQNGGTLSTDNREIARILGL